MQTDKHNGSLDDKFKGHEVAPTSDLWSNIEAKLNEKNDKKIIAWWWFGGLAAVLALGFGVYQFAYVGGETFITNLSQMNPTSIHHVKKQNVCDRIAIVDSTGLTNKKNAMMGDEENTSVAQTNQTKARQIKKVESSDSKTRNGKEKGRILNTAQVKTFPLVNEDKKEKKINRETATNGSIDLLALTSIIQLSPDLKNKELDLAMNLEKGKRTTGSWEIGLNYQYFTSAQSSLKKENIDFTVTAVEADTVNELSDQEKANFASEASRISIPVNVNVSIGYQINHRLTVRSGLGWQNIVEHYANSKKININGIKIPIVLQWNFIDQFRWGLFVNGGFNNEFNFTKISTDNINQFVASNDSQESSHQTNYNTSIQIDLGYKYYLSDRLSFEASPSLRYALRNNVNTKSWFVGGQVGLYWKLN